MVPVSDRQQSTSSRQGEAEQEYPDWFSGAYADARRQACLL